MRGVWERDLADILWTEPELEESAEDGIQHETEQAVHAASARPSKSRSTIQTEETNHPHSAEVRPLDLILEGSPSHQGLKIMKGNENNNRTKCNFRPFQASMPKIHLNHYIPPLPLLSIIFSSRRRPWALWALQYEDKRSPNCRLPPSSKKDDRPRGEGRCCCEKQFIARSCRGMGRWTV